MQPVLTAAEMAELDRYTIERLGLDGKLLMSNAAREVLRAIEQRFPQARRPVIFAGTGNNGGDGVALAYYAQQAGLKPLLVLCHPEITAPPKLSEDSAYFFRICEQAYVPVRYLANPALAPEVISSAEGDLLVDALFGTGLDRPLGEYYLALLERLEQAGRPVVAVDCPSGLNCTTGEIMDGALHAALTVTMGYPKRGFFHPGAVEYLGELSVAQLGFSGLTDAGLTPGSHTWSDALWAPLKLPRCPDTHKGNYGRVLIVAGHARYPGAPRLAARAALATGTGLVRLVVPEPIYQVCCDHPAVMTAAHPADAAGGFAATPDSALLEYLDWADALLIGPGLGEGNAAQALTRELLTQRDIPVLLDADGLRLLSGEAGAAQAQALQAAHPTWPLVLTPHVGELARLAGVIPGEAADRWFELALELADRLGVLLLAKSCQCVLASPEGGLLFPRRGHPALATGGTGDVLSGIAAALMARYHAAQRDHSLGLSTAAALRRMALAEIVVSAVNIHAAAGSLGAARYGENGLDAAKLCELIPEALRSLAATPAS